MSEQIPTTNPDELAAQQFDSEAAQKAKDFLEEGVTRVSWVDENGNAAIVDSNHSTINNEAKRFTSTIKREDDKAKELQARASFLMQKEQTVSEVANTLKDLTPEQKVQLDEMRDTLMNTERQDVVNRQLAAEERRDAALWRGREHYLENQEGYVAAAVEDANAAGHDVNLSGHHFPAQAPETQSQQVAPEKNDSEGSEGQVHVGVARMSSGNIPTYEISEEDAIKRTKELVESGQITESLPIDEKSTK